MKKGVKKGSIEYFKNDTCVVYKMHKTVGMFSDCGFLAETYFRAKRAGYDFYVDSSEWSYKVEKGWHDYFTSLVEYSDDVKQNYGNIITARHIIDPNNNYTIKNIDGNKSMHLKDYSSTFKELFQLKPVIKNRAEEKLAAYENYEAIYIRRGDKITSGESSYQPTKHILDQLQLSSDKALFVQTDDYNEVQEIRKLLPGKKIYHIVKESRMGSNESDRQQKKGETYESTEELLQGIFICTKASKCWVDAKSNVSRFIKLYSPGTVEFYKIGNETISFHMDKEVPTNVAFEQSFM